jgi:hypothetical protein
MPKRIVRSSGGQFVRKELPTERLDRMMREISAETVATRRAEEARTTTTRKKGAR